MKWKAHNLNRVWRPGPWRCLNVNAVKYDDSAWKLCKRGAARDERACWYAIDNDGWIMKVEVSSVILDQVKYSCGDGEHNRINNVVGVVGGREE